MMPMQVAKLIGVAMLVGLLCFPVRAETYRGIGYKYTLNDVMAIFPGADFQKMEVAWTQENEVLYSIAGPGIEGAIIVMFDDYRPMLLRWAKEEADEGDLDLATTYAEIADAEDKHALQAMWVRWVADRPIPIARLVKIYGDKFEKGYLPADYTPYMNWKNRGVIAYLSDDEKGAKMIQYEYTEAEKKQREEQLKKQREGSKL